MPEFYAVLDAKTGELLDTAVQSAQKLLDEIKLSEPEDFFFSTLDGESHVHGFVMMPHDAKKVKNIRRFFTSTEVRIRFTHMV